MQLIDTHCHIHSIDYALPVDEVEVRAHDAGVTRLICVGYDVDNSRCALEFVKNRSNAWASIGLHPHEAASGERALKMLGQLIPHDNQEKRADKVVAIGECGLDYFHNHSSKSEQEKALRFQIELAITHNLPLIFHVRNAFDDFWRIFDSYKDLRGVLHSFTDTQENLDKAVQRGLYVGVNGIITFTKYQWQLDAAKEVPIERLLFETDTPFLTPAPLRGKVNEPAHLALIAKFVADLRHESLEGIATATTRNALQLFSI